MKTPGKLQNIVNKALRNGENRMKKIGGYSFSTADLETILLYIENWNNGNLHRLSPARGSLGKILESYGIS